MGPEEAITDSGVGVAAVRARDALLLFGAWHRQVGLRYLERTITVFIAAAFNFHFFLLVKFPSVLFSRRLVLKPLASHAVFQ